MPTNQALTLIPLNVVVLLALLTITTFTQAQTWVITDQSHPITSPSNPSYLAPYPQPHTKPPRSSKAASTHLPANAYKPISPKPSKI